MAHLPSLRLLTRADCEICQELHAILLNAGILEPEELEVIDIDEHPDLRAIYHYRVPVILRGNAELWVGPVNEDAFARLCAALRTVSGSER